MVSIRVFRRLMISSSRILERLMLLMISPYSSSRTTRSLKAVIRYRDMWQ